MTFYRVREILQGHFLFQIALASRVAEWDSLEMIGDVFVASVSLGCNLEILSSFLFTRTLDPDKKNTVSSVSDSSGHRFFI